MIMCERQNISGRYLLQHTTRRDSLYFFLISSSSTELNCTLVKIIIVAENEFSNLTKKYV